MNKKVNTLLFILGGTVFNVLVTIGSAALLLLLYVRFLKPILPDSADGWFFILMFIGSLAIAFVVYRAVIKFLMKRIEVEKYFDPIFVSRYKKPKPNQ